MKKLVLLLMLFILASSIVLSQENKNKTTTSPPDREIVEEIEIIVEKIERCVLKNAPGGEGAAPAEKTQFDVILKSRIFTDKNGEFSITIPDEQFRRIQEGSSFDLVLKIKPPKDFKGVYDSDKAKVTLNQKDGPTYKLILKWIPIKSASNKGSFAVSAKAQT